MKVSIIKIVFIAMTIQALLGSCADDNSVIAPITQDIKFGLPTEVSINGYTDHAMEPFISPDGTTLFFNSINDGNNTKLYYATKVDATTFTFVGELEGVNEVQSAQLNAVADLDNLNNFYWTSGRDYPNEPDNLHHGIFENGNVTSIGRVRGDFYNYDIGWLVMDHGISYDGQFLFYNNARFDSANCVGPCETFLGIAKRSGNKLFIKTSDSDTILQNINNQNYIYYAPCITQDNLELYYTRFPKGTLDNSTMVDICVATRATESDIFSPPQVLFSDNLMGSIIEAPSLTTDKKIMYYHKKIGGVHKILSRERE